MEPFWGHTTDASKSERRINETGTDSNVCEAIPEDGLTMPIYGRFSSIECVTAQPKRSEAMI